MVRAWTDMRSGGRARLWLAFGLCAALTAPALGAEPLAGFECVERLGLDWPRTMLTYRVSFPPGQAQAGQLRLLDDGGRAHPVQLWRMKRHGDGSIASARVSFMAALPAKGRLRRSLVAGPPTRAPSKLSASPSGNVLTLDNGIVAIRLPRAGEHRFAKPLRLGSSQAEMVKLYGRQAASGIAPGPLQGIRLVDGRWAGGSYFILSKESVTSGKLFPSVVILF